MKGNQCCGNCYYWLNWSPPVGTTGSCRRYPPGSQAVYARSDYWCGEWRAENPTVTDEVTLGLARARIAGDLTAGYALVDKFIEIREEEAK